MKCFQIEATLICVTDCQESALVRHGIAKRRGGQRPVWDLRTLSLVAYLRKPTEWFLFHWVQLNQQWNNSWPVGIVGRFQQRASQCPSLRASPAFSRRRKNRKRRVKEKLRRRVTLRKERLLDRQPPRRLVPLRRCRPTRKTLPQRASRGSPRRQPKRRQPIDRKNPQKRGLLSVPHHAACATPTVALSIRCRSSIAGLANSFPATIFRAGRGTNSTRQS